MNRLMVGSGITRREGWKTLDANPRMEPDFLVVLPPLTSAVTEQQWDEIEWIHGVTSLEQWQGVDVLREIYTCLKPGGMLVLEQPDFRKAIEKPEWTYGDPTFRNPLIMNRWGYTPGSLTDVLRDIGFSRIDIGVAKYHIPFRDFRVEAYR